MPKSRKYYKVDYQDILNNPAKKDRLTILFEQLKEKEEEAKTQKPVKTEDVVETTNTVDTAEAKLEPEEFNEPPKVMVPTKKNPNQVDEIMSIDISDEEENPGYHTQTDARLTDAINYIDYVDNFMNVVHDINDKVKTCQEVVYEQDRIIQDLLHEARQPVKSSDQGFALYKLLHRAERKRQDYKDLIDPLMLISKYLTAHQSIFDGLSPIIKLAKQRVENQETRLYMQRSQELKLPVGNDYRNLSREEQIKIKQYYEANKHKEKYGF